MTDWCSDVFAEILMSFRKTDLYILFPSLQQFFFVVLNTRSCTRIPVLPYVLLADASRNALVVIINYSSVKIRGVAPETKISPAESLSWHRLVPLSLQDLRQENRNTGSVPRNSVIRVYVFIESCFWILESNLDLLYLAIVACCTLPLTGLWRSRNDIQAALRSSFYVNL